MNTGSFVQGKCVKTQDISPILRYFYPSPCEVSNVQTKQAKVFRDGGSTVPDKRKGLNLSIIDDLYDER
jgi:hypothetical protein